MLIDNILFLRNRFPEVRKYFSEYEAELQLESYNAVDSKSGAKTIQYEQPNSERAVMIHSLYDPIKEAERIIASNKEKIHEKTHVFFYGVGMGYHIEKFIETYPDLTYSVYEPIPEIFLRMSENRDLDKIINQNMQHLYVDRHNGEELAYLEEFNTSNQNIHLIVLPSYKSIINDKYETFHKNIKETILNRRSNLHTDAAFQKRWVENSIINFKTVLDTPNMLKDIDRTQFEGKPALIVSAGPSLAEDIEHIRYIKENNLAYIFSVGSAINSLIEYDVLPDAVFTYDPKERNQNVFNKMFEKNIKHIPMVFGSSVGHETIERYNGPKVHFITSQDKISLYLLREELDLQRDLIFDSPSIAVMTFQITNKLGCDPIIFTGQNLGYLNGKRFAEGIDYSHIPSKVDEETLINSIITKDVYGGTIKTNKNFNNMRKAIEGYIEAFKGTTFINTTKGGANISGAEFIPIEKVINEKLIDSITKVNWWLENSGYNLDQIPNKYNEILISIQKFSSVIYSLERVLDSIQNNLKIKNRFNIGVNLQKFDDIYNDLNENLYYAHFLSFFMRTEVKFFANEINRLNIEPNLWNRSKGLLISLENFIYQLKQSDKLLRNLFTSKLPYNKAGIKYE